MAGKGPPPRQGAIRGNLRPDFRIVEARSAEQPDLPNFHITIQVDEKMVTQEFTWPGQTIEWWRMWADHPMSAEFTESDWSFLLDTALIHASYWNGNMKAAGELRLRVAKFGVTPEDRARLRIQFATADQIEQKGSSRRSGGPSSRERYSGLRTVD